MKKYKKFIVLLLSCIMFVLSGCARQEYDVRITEQNGVEFTVKLIISKERYNTMATFGVDVKSLEENKVQGTGSEVDKVNAMFQEEAMKFKDKGFTITALDDAVEMGFMAKKSYLTIEEFNAEIKNLKENHMSGLDLDIQYKDTTNHKEYKAYGTIEYAIDPDMGLDDEIIKGYFDKQYDSSSMTCKVNISMPTTTQITAHDGSNSQGGALEWQTAYGKGVKDVHIVSEYHDNSMYYMIGAGAIVLIAVVGFFVSKSIRLKKEKKNSALRDEYEYEASQNEQR